MPGPKKDAARKEAQAPDDPATPDPWHVYVLQSQARAVTYVGIAKDVQARLAQHNGDTKGGAKSTRAARPWTLARTLGPYDSRGEAQSVEYALKQKPAQQRLSGD